MSNLDNRATEEKLNIHDNKHILSYLSLLEKFYEQSQEKSHQERLFRINKAINSIKKYSKCKVSSFNFKSTKSLHNNNQKLNMPKTNVEQGAPFGCIGGENSVEDILYLIGKELKLNGINEKDINNSLLSTSKKSLNSSENLEIYENFEKKSSASTTTNVIDKSNTEEILPKTNLNSKRLSKLFLKIELKLKTFLQENNMRNDINNLTINVNNLTNQVNIIRNTVTDLSNDIRDLRNESDNSNDNEENYDDGEDSSNESEN